MPVVEIKLNVTVSEQVLAALSAEVTVALCDSLDPSCATVMVSHTKGPIFVNRTSAPAAWVQVRSAVDLEIEAKRAFCRRLGEALAKHCGLDPQHVFLQLSRIASEDAWNLTAQGPRCVRDRLADQVKAKPTA
jgi:phenylpyruvate tautomerase PptA (4-oxalocrotonate tautomerase family)